uniref:Tripartite motif-containing protein 2 n=1 Tax=Magallana gigas TaxID=29159 RepID=K1QNM0_MAGGI
MKVTKSYAEGVGTRPSFTFSPNDIAADHLGNLLVAVPNDNAIHLLDKNLTFKKLLMTEEDGLRGPTSVALDTEGYLYVGCKNNHIHVVNYQYFLSTNRLTRLKNDMKQF